MSWKIGSGMHYQYGPSHNTGTSDRVDIFIHSLDFMLKSDGWNLYASVSGIYIDPKTETGPGGAFGSIYLKFRNRNRSTCG